MWNILCEYKPQWMKKKCACPNIENSSKKNVPFKPCGNGCVFQGMHMREIVVFPKRCMCSPREWWCSSRKCLCSSRRCVCFTKKWLCSLGRCLCFPRKWLCSTKRCLWSPWIKILVLFPRGNGYVPWEMLAFIKKCLS